MLGVEPLPHPRLSPRVSNRILLLFAHPAFERSAVNARLIAAARTVPGVEIHDLYETYPDFNVHVRAEQERLAAADVIVLQHPLLWYSVPALLKQWFDLVLEHGWAYGSTGNALRGKRVLSAITAGGPADAYHAEGLNHFTARELLTPVQQTFQLCGCNYLGPFAVFGTHRLPADAADAHATDYARLLGALVAGKLDLDAARRAPVLNPLAASFPLPAATPAASTAKHSRGHDTSS